MAVKCSMHVDSAFIALCRVLGCPKVRKYKVTAPNVTTYEILKHLAYTLILKADRLFVFPNPFEDVNGFERGKCKAVRGTQDRYGHAAVMDTPEKEKRSKRRFSAQSTLRKQHVRQ